jgi:Glyoxalase-like domain
MAPVARRIQVAIDCESPDRLATFWAEVLDYRIMEPPNDFATWSAYSQAAASQPGEAWSKVVDPGGRGPNVLFHRVPEPKVVKNRVHLDVWVGPEGDKNLRRPFVDSEARRLVGLGATHVRTDEDEVDYYAVMRDPEGNEFCIN